MDYDYDYELLEDFNDILEDTDIRCPNCDHENMVIDGDMRFCQECGYDELDY